jgi:hypothetical protein
MQLAFSQRPEVKRGSFMTVREGIQGFLLIILSGCVILIILVVIHFFPEDTRNWRQSLYPNSISEAQIHMLLLLAYCFGGALIVVGCAGVGLIYYAGKPESDNRVLRFIQFLTKQAANLPEEKEVSSAQLPAISKDISAPQHSKPSKEEKQFNRYETERRFDIKEKVFEALEAATELEIQNRVVYKKLVTQINRNPDLDDDEKDELIRNLTERYNKQREKSGLPIFEE